jgi:hypothetical protein
MSEDTFMISEMNFVKIVHVELAYEGGKTVVTVVARKDCLLEFFLIDDADTFTVGVPNDGFGVLFGLNRICITLRML